MTTQNFKVSRTYPIHQYENWITQTAELIETIPQFDDIFFWGAKGNGTTDDTAAIQAAVNATSFLVFPPGTFLITSTISLNSNQCILGPGTIKADVNGSAITISGKTNVCVEGLTINHTLVSNLGYPSINNIYVVNSSYVYLRNNKLFHLNGFVNCIGIQFDNGATQCLAEGNTVRITDPLYSPATVQNPGLQQACIFCNGGATFIDIIGNLLRNHGVGVGIQTVNAVDASDILVSNNIVSEMGHYGMYNYLLSAIPRRITYIGNKINNVYGSYYNLAVNALSHGAGIYNQSGDTVSIIGNTITNTCILTNNQSLAPGGIGSLLASNFMLISGNTITQSNMYGIIGDGRNVTITGNNIIDSTLTSVYFRDCLYGTVSGNTIENRGIAASLGSRGIFSLGVAPTRFITITGNFLRNFGISILLQNTNNFTVANNVIQCDDAIVATGSGITTDGTCAQGNISGNIISRNGGFGIRNLGDFINVTNNVTNGTLVNQAISNGVLTNNNYGTNITDTANTTNATGVVTIASANNIILPYCMNENLWIVITGVVQINTIFIPFYKRANMTINIVGPVGLVLANNTAGTGLVLLNTSGANITIATANIEVISYRCNGSQWVQF
jgi:hypothetical protein